jgi:hypothetical protein
MTPNGVLLEKNGNCVYMHKFCDGKDNCGDNSDEKQPCPP